MSIDKDRIEKKIADMDFKDRHRTGFRYLCSFIGDLRISDSTDADFEKLIDQTGSPNLQYLKVACGRCIASYFEISFSGWKSKT